MAAIKRDFETYLNSFTQTRRQSLTVVTYLERKREKTIQGIYISTRYGSDATNWSTRDWVEFLHIFIAVTDSFGTDVTCTFSTDSTDVRNERLVNLILHIIAALHYEWLMILRNTVWSIFTYSIGNIQLWILLLQSVNTVMPRCHFLGRWWWWWWYWRGGENEIRVWDAAKGLTLCVYKCTADLRSRV